MEPHESESPPSGKDLDDAELSDSTTDDSPIDLQLRRRCSRCGPALHGPAGTWRQAKRRAKCPYCRLYCAIMATLAARPGHEHWNQDNVEFRPIPSFVTECSEGMVIDGVVVEIHGSEEAVLYDFCTDLSNHGSRIQSALSATKVGKGGVLTAGLDLRRKFWFVDGWPRALLLRPTISRNTGDEQTIDWATRHVTQCLGNHVDCTESSELQSPSRVLDIQFAISEGKIKLIDSTSWRSGKPPYACVSYCWGITQSKVLGTATHAEFMTGLDLVTLPQGLQDVIVFARKMGLRFLWIDSLCIMQDEENAESREAEVAKMGDIFEGSLLTFSLTKSSNVEESCLASQTDDQFGIEIDTDILGKDRRFRVRPSLKHFLRLRSSSSDHLDHVLRDDVTLFKRAWAFQEGLLSKRILHFSFTELVWECMYITSCQCEQDMTKMAWTPYRLALHGTRSEQAPLDTAGTAMERWTQLVSLYCQAQLTKEEDRPGAFKGVQDKFISHLGPSLNCMWTTEKYLLPSLLWYVDEERTISEAQVVHDHPAKMPSWTWISACKASGRNIKWESESRSVGVAVSIQSRVLFIHATELIYTSVHSLTLDAERWAFHADRLPVSNPTKAILLVRLMELQWLALERVEKLGFYRRIGLARDKLANSGFAMVQKSEDSQTLTNTIAVI